jgi:hypothetical protein
MFIIYPHSQVQAGSQVQEDTQALEDSQGNQAVEDILLDPDHQDRQVQLFIRISIEL